MKQRKRTQNNEQCKAVYPPVIDLIFNSYARVKRYLIGAIRNQFPSTPEHLIEDRVHDGLLKGVQCCDRYQGAPQHQDILRWLAVVTLNMIRDQIHQTKRRKELLGEHWDEDAQTRDEDTELRSIALINCQRLDRFAHELCTPTQRAALQRLIKGQVLTGTERTHLKRARAKLIDQML